MEALEHRFAGSHHRQTCAEHSSGISTIFVRALIEAVEAAGAPVEQFLREAGISSPQFATPYGWVEAAEFDRLTCRAVELTGDPAFGLHWVERSPMTKFDLLAMVIAHAPTLRECLACVLRFQPILFERPELEVAERSDSLLLRVVPLATSELGLRVRTEVAVSCLMRLLRHVGAPVAAARRVMFAHRAPPYAHEYARLFAGRVRFEHAHSGIEIDPVWLDRRLHNSNLELHELLAVHAEHVLAQVQSRVGYAGQVREYVSRHLPRLPEMREAARGLALSERSLRRRLAEEGCSYSTILQESQLLLAQRLLADPKRSIQQIAHDVGFTNTAAFHRAFKRWTDASPAVFRRRGVRLDHNMPRSALVQPANTVSLEPEQL